LTDPTSSARSPFEEVVFPIGALERMGGDVLRQRVELGRDDVLLVGDLRPVAREDLVGLAAEQEGVRLFEPARHRLARFVVDEGHDPAAVLEASAGVLLRPAGAWPMPSRVMNVVTVSFKGSPLSEVSLR
jgi:hypothetical protein